MNEPPTCIECGQRPCETEEDEICRHCWDEMLWAANMRRELRIAAGWTRDKTGAVIKPK